MAKKIFPGFLILLAGVFGVLFLRAKPIPPHPFFVKNGVMAIAHRGGMGLWPENTLYAFQKAEEMGADILEMDLRSTAEGALVVLHDLEVDRTTNGKGLVNNLSLKALKELDAGYHWTGDQGKTFPFRGRGITVPTLREVFDALPEARMSIEMKNLNPSMADSLCRAIREHKKTDTVLVSSFHHEALEEFRSLCPEVATSAGEEEAKLFYIMNLAFLAPFYSPAFHALQVPEYADGRHVATRRFIETAHGRNLAVSFWTVNEEDAMRRLLALGVDGLITDYPDRLLRVLGRSPLQSRLE